MVSLSRLNSLLVSPQVFYKSPAAVNVAEEQSKHFVKANSLLLCMYSSIIEVDFSGV